MPKKGRGKEGPSPKGGKKGGAEAMPQVWLPDQPNPELHMDLSDSFPDLSHNEEGPPPTVEEQHQMALFWAKEEAQAPRGWDEEQELDYSEVVRKREEREKEEREKVETPDLFKYSQSSVFSVKALGFVSGVMRAESQTSTLETIDTAQKQGRLPWATSDKDHRLFSISKYGIKVTDSQRQRVFTRHPLHQIVNITYYEDTYKKHMLAVRVSGGGEDGQQELIRAFFPSRGCPDYSILSGLHTVHSFAYLRPLSSHTLFSLFSSLMPPSTDTYKERVSHSGSDI